MDITIRKRLLQTFVALLVVLFMGTIGYYSLTHGQIDLFTCFYMTVITITTIGFDEVIILENFPGSREFTIFLAFAGIGILTYFVSTVSAIVIEGHLRETYKKRRMEKSIDKLKGHFIVCGVGRHAIHLIEELIATQRQCVFVEMDDSVIKNVMRRFPMQLYIEGDATNDEVLLRAGIKNAKGLFASTSDDNMNLVICLTARNINPDIKIVALCTNNANQVKMKVAGADTIVSPNYIGGIRMASEMVRPTVTTFLDKMLHERDNMRIDEVEMTESNDGMKISDFTKKDLKTTLIIAVNRNNELIFKPDDDFLISKGDSLIVMTVPSERIKLEET